MSFRFSLQAVLHLYEGLEHQHELRLRTANQQVARVRHLIEQLDALRQHNRAQQARELEAGKTGAELQFERAMELALMRRRGEMDIELARAQQLRDEQQRIFRQARRRRETLSTLRETPLHHYQREAARREQRQVDEAFLLRRKPLS
jgi:flagellar export protein FliJ